MVRNLPADAGDARDEGSITGSRRSPGGGNGNPLQFSCLGNSMDIGPYSPWGPKESRLTSTQPWLLFNSSLNFV